MHLLMIVVGLYHVIFYSSSVMLEILFEMVYYTNCNRQFSHIFFLCDASMFAAAVAVGPLSSVRAQTAVNSSMPNCTYYSHTRQYCYILATEANGTTKVADWPTALDYCRTTQLAISGSGITSTGHGSLVGVYDSDVTATLEK